MRNLREIIMKKLFLASSVDVVAPDIAKHLPAKGLKLVFINTPAEGEDGDKQWLENDRAALVKEGFVVSDYTVTGKTSTEIKDHLAEFDVIFISGGNTFYALEKIQQSGCAEIIHDYVEQGKIYIGSSAGSVLAGPDIYPSYYVDAIEKAPNLKGYRGLDLIDVVVLPHWGNDYFKELYLNKRLEHVYTPDHKIILLTDNQYLSVENDKYEIIDVSKHEKTI